jgi:DNA-binding transcriptional regulator YbjK
MVKRLKIAWAESADELEARYKVEKQIERRTRLLALWHLRQGKRIEEVAQRLSGSYRSVQNWLRW